MAQEIGQRAQNMRFAGTMKHVEEACAAVVAKCAQQAAQDADLLTKLDHYESRPMSAPWPGVIHAPLAHHKPQAAADAPPRPNTQHADRSQQKSRRATDKIAALEAQVQAARQARLAAESRLQELSREFEAESTGYTVYAHLPRKEERLTTSRKQELAAERLVNQQLGLEHERRRVLTHLEKEKAAFVASLRPPKSS